MEVTATISNWNHDQNHLPDVDRIYRDRITIQLQVWTYYINQPLPLCLHIVITCVSDLAKRAKRCLMTNDVVMKAVETQPDTESATAKRYSMYSH